MKDTTASWNLDDLVLLKDFESLRVQTKQNIDELEQAFAGFSPEMKTEDFVKYLDMQDAAIDTLSRLGARTSLMESVDQKDKQALKLKNQIKDIEIYATERLQKVSLWLKGLEVDDKMVLDDANAKRLFAAAGDREYGLTYSRQMARFSLTEREEVLNTGKDANGVSVINDLRDMIETEFKFHFKPKGSKKEIIESLAEINAKTYSADPAVRAEAYRARCEQYTTNIDKFFVIYQAIVKDWNFEAKLRGYTSPISVRNVANQVSDKSIEVLMEVCGQNLEVFRRFFRYKAQALGMPKLTRFDIYAPLAEESAEISYDEAKQMVLEAFTGFSPDFAAKAKLIIDEDHVDSHPSPTKRGGAFCATITPAVSPYVFLNYTGKDRDVSTLAHELGHGVHSLYANGHTIGTQHPNLPLAETASTFGEMVLFEKLLNSTTDAKIKKSLLADKLGDAYAGICRQNYFVKFEIAAHGKIQAGITEPELSEIWMDMLREQFGDAVAVDDMFRHEWAYIPHIHHTPFYCYAYNFGELLSMALYARYKAEGESFIPAIEKILAAGGAEEPAAVLKAVGVDMEDPAFWQGSFAIIEGWMDQLEAL